MLRSVVRSSVWDWFIWAVSFTGSVGRTLAFEGNAKLWLICPFFFWGGGFFPRLLVKYEILCFTSSSLLLLLLEKSCQYTLCLYRSSWTMCAHLYMCMNRVYCECLYISRRACGLAEGVFASHGNRRRPRVSVGAACGTEGPRGAASSAAMLAPRRASHAPAEII